MRATAAAVVLSFFCMAVSIFMDGFNGVSLLAVLFMFAALCIAPLERRKQ